MTFPGRGLQNFEFLEKGFVPRFQNKAQEGQESNIVVHPRVSISVEPPPYLAQAGWLEPSVFLALAYKTFFKSQISVLDPA